MAIKPLHGVALAVVGCVALAFAKLPPERIVRIDYPSSTHPLRAEKDRLSAEIVRTTYRWRLTTLRDSVLTLMRSGRRSSSPAPTVFADTAFSPALRELSRRVMLRTWTDMGIDSTLVPTAFLVISDTAPPAGLKFETASGYEFVVPGNAASPQNPCVGILRLGNAVRNSVGVARSLQFGWRSYGSAWPATTAAGPCAFYGAFGAPGPKIAEWLDRYRYAYAMSSNWEQGTYSMKNYYPFGMSRILISSYGATNDIKVSGIHGRRCWVGNLQACEEMIVGSPEAPTPFQLRQPDGIYSGETRGVLWLGDSDSRYLADMRRDIGPEKFRAFWTSSDEPATAFHNATGERLGAWTNRWITSIHGSTIAGAKIPTGHFVWGVVFALGCVSAAALGARRREVR